MPELQPPANSITGAIEQVKTFLTEPLAQKRDDLEKILSELESKLAPVLKKVQAGEEAFTHTASGILRNSEDSPLYNAIQDFKQEAGSVHTHYESVRNRISGLIDRLHLS